MAKYSKVQFIAFNIRPGQVRTNPCPVIGCACPQFDPHPKNLHFCKGCNHDHVSQKKYLGDTEATKDIKIRCAIMKKAIETAFHDANLLKAKVRRCSWNVFSKKEPVLKIFMAPEFYFRGSEGGYPVENVSQIMETMREETQYKAYKDWLFVFGTAIGYQKHEETLSKILKKKDNFNIEIDTVARTIVEDCEVRGRKTGVSRKVKKAEKKTKPDSTYYEIELKAGGYFEQGELIEIGWPNDRETEVFNIALIQKGGPSSSKPPSREGAKERVTDPNRELIVYKEHVSGIDYLPGSVKGKYLIHGEDRRILETEKSGESSEISKSGLGGGSVFTVDNITFGVEVCLDHACNRLKNYYDYHANKSDQKVQIHLIPSWGMSIVGGKICCVDKGLVFNVDGSRSDSEVRIMKDHKEYCCTECNFIQSKPGVCLKCNTSYCTTCDKFRPPKTTCAVCSTALSKVFHCPEHGEQGKLSLSQNNCSVCNKKKVVYESKLQPIGTLVKSKVAIPVTHPGICEYFESDGKIVVYEERNIAKAEIV